MTVDPHRDQPVLAGGHRLAGAAGAVILLHGRGASAQDILDLGKEFGRDDLGYLAPQAATHSWYPFSFLAPLAQNEPWLTSALAKVEQIVQSVENEGIHRNRIVLAGFSQGACLATEFAARNAARYGGLIALTGGLIGPPGTSFRYPGQFAGMPAFLGAGDPDPHVPWYRVKASASLLSEMGAEVVVKRYPEMPHTVNLSELEEVRKLLAQTFGAGPLG